MSTPALDRRRLLADLDATLADLRVGRWPTRAAKYWRLRGFEQAVRVLRAAIVDGEYNLPLTGPDQHAVLTVADVRRAAKRERWPR